MRACAHVIDTRSYPVAPGLTLLQPIVAVMEDQLCHSHACYVWIVPVLTSLRCGQGTAGHQDSSNQGQTMANVSHGCLSAPAGGQQV
jgi:hypothetical protein